jgi:anti-sigma factor RsiW
MTLNRKTLEEYLDGELSPRDTAEVDQALQSDEKAQRLLKQLAVEQSCRRAALADYQPTAGETLSALDSFQDRCDRELIVGRIHPVWLWGRRIGSIAAVLALTFGAYALGRNAQPSSSSPAQGFIVQVMGVDGQMTTREFATMQEARKFADELSKRPEGLASVDYGMF